MKALFTLAISLLMAVSAIAETKTATFTVDPPMGCDNCVRKIKNNLRFEKGMVEVTPLLEKQVVVVRYNSDKTNVDKIKKGFEKIGYTASEATAASKPATATKADACRQDD